jgi:hypothetical protein
VAGRFESKGLAATPFASLVFLLSLVGLIAGAYLVRLHGDVVFNRATARAIRTRTTIDVIMRKILKPRDTENDRVRGIEFVVGLLAAISLSTGIAIYYLTQMGLLATAVAVETALVSTVSLVSETAPHG